MDVSWGPLVGMQLHAAHGRTDTHPRKAEKWEAWRPVHSPGPYSWAWARRQPGAPRSSPAPPSFKQGSRRAEGIAEPQDMQLGLVVPKAKQSEFLDPQGVQKPGFSPTHTLHPSLPFSPCRLSKPSPAAHLPPHLCPPQAAFFMLLPSWKICSHFCCFQILIWSIQLRAAS